MHNHPSLECVTMFIFAYMPYGLSEGLELSGKLIIIDFSFSYLLILFLMQIHLDLSSFSFSNFCK